MVAAVSKLMRNQDLIAVARKCHVVTAFRNTIGLPGHLAVRLQPNHPTDDPAGVAASILDGLMHGSGDAVIGINPATDSPEAMIDLLKLIDEVRERIDIPTQSCVLAHVTTAIDVMARNAPVDLVFQSIAGTQKANESFGITQAMLAEAEEAAKGLKRGTVGNNVMYFETGQGAALSADAHEGVDQQTVETRAYAVARKYSPFWSIPSSVSSGRNICLMANRSLAPVLRTISVANCLACRWAAMFAIPTMPKPIRMIWITF